MVVMAPVEGLARQGRRSRHMAQSERARRLYECPLLGTIETMPTDPSMSVNREDRKWPAHGQNDANDPNRTSGERHRTARPSGIERVSVLAFRSMMAKPRPQSQTRHDETAH